ncbi:MAG: fibronectin type III domain-containing protein [Pirellulales bacterium]
MAIFSHLPGRWMGVNRFKRRRGPGAPGRSRTARTPRLEVLDCRITMDAALAGFVASLNQGLNSLESHSREVAAAYAKDITNLPLIREQVDTIFATDTMKRVFTVPDVQVTATDAVDQVIAKLSKQGFRVDYISSTVPNARGNFLEVVREVDLRAIPIDATLGQESGFAYLTGSPSGRLTGNVSSLAGRMHYVIDSTGFHVAADSEVRSRISLAGDADGLIQVGLLKKVDLGGRVTVSAQSTWRLQDGDGDGKLNWQDLTSTRHVVGQLTGSIEYAARFSTQIPDVGVLGWSGQFSATINHDQFRTQSTLVAPDYRRFLDNVGGQFLTKLQDATWLQGLDGYLSKKLPVVNQSIAELMKVEEQYRASLSTVGLKVLTPAEGAAAMKRFIQGERVDLLKFDKKLSVGTSTNVIPDVPLGRVDFIPGLVGAEASLTVTANASIGIEIHAGIDLDGIWLSPDSKLRATAEMEGAIHGKLNVLGHGLIKGKGSLSIPATLSVSPYDRNGDGHVYLSEVRAAPSATLVTYFDVDLKLNLKAKIDLGLFEFTVFSKSYTLANIIHVEMGSTGTRSLPEAATVTDTLEQEPDRLRIAAAPQLQLGTVEAQSITVRWPVVPGAEKTVLDVAVEGESQHRSYETTGNSFTIRDLPADRRVALVAQSANRMGVSPASAPLSTRTLAVIPTAPANLRTANVWAQTIDLRWDDRSHNETGFQVLISRDGGQSWQHVGSVAADTSSLRVTDLRANTRYQFKVRAVNTAGYSNDSPILTVTTRTK